MELKKNRAWDPNLNETTEINIDRLSVCVPPEKKSWFRRKSLKPSVPILKDVSCRIKEGELVAVIGPSGAGKTTFLVSLAGKCTLPAEGSITVNNRNVKHLPKGFVEIVPQFEAFMGSLTVSEHLRFMTEMKLGSCRKPENRTLLSDIITDFSLKSRADTRINSLSGGERRLLSLATSLLSCPRIIICDEPTTGLDSYNALLVVAVLKKLAKKGATVICSIHQPSSILFKEFYSIMLMAEGRLLFYGLQEDCKDMFDSIGLRCPKNYNPAEFYIRAISPDPNTNDSNIDRIAETFKKRSSEFEDRLEATTISSRVTYKLCQRNWFIQICLLLWRSSLTLKREIKDQIYQLAISMMISGTIIGTCYVGITGTTQKGIQDMQGFLWLITSEIAYGLSYNALYAFDHDIILFRREVGVYSVSAYFVSRLLSFIPKCIIWPLVFVNIATVAVELPEHALTTVELIAALMCGAVCATAFGLGMGAMFSSTNMTGEFMTLVELPLFLVSGTFLRLSSIPLWLYAVKSVSHFFYILDLVSNIYWRKIEDIECPSNSTTLCIKDGATFLWQSGYSSNFLIIDSFGLIMLTLGWSVIGYFGLKREEKKGYAY